MLIAAVVAVLFDRMRLPSILGFLLTGVAVGPYGFGVIADIDQIQHLAEWGVVLLLLTIGLEFSFERIRGLRLLAFVGGGVQLLLSIGLGMAFAWWKGWLPSKGFLLGTIVALSSTAIVLKYLIDRGELDTQHGRVAVAILIFQDLAVVPLMILTTTLGNPDGSLVQAIGIAGIKALFFLGGILIIAKYCLPPVLHSIAKSRNREIFFLTCLVICLASAWASNQLGLSLALGAFFAGLMFANTEYGHQLMGEIVPFRHVFVNLFFVSVGLLFDVHFALANMLSIMRIVGLVIVVNFIVMSIVIVAFGNPPRIALAAGLMLSQIGEFSFLILEAARNSGALDAHFYQLMLSVAFITMMGTPLLFWAVRGLLHLSAQTPFFGKPPSLQTSKRASVEEHVIVCGFGPTGTDVCASLQEEGFSVVLLEINPRHVRQARDRGIQVIYGDAVNVEVLRHAGIHSARAVVVTFGDPLGMKQIIRSVEHLNPDVTLIVRTRFERDVADLYEAGADIVIMDEWEAGYELHRILLEQLGVPPDRVTRHLTRVSQRKELLIERAILEGEDPIAD